MSNWTFALVLVTCAGNAVPYVVGARRSIWERRGYGERRCHRATAVAQFPYGRSDVEAEIIPLSPLQTPSELSDAVSGWDGGGLVAMQIGEAEVAALQLPTGEWDLEKIWALSVDAEWDARLEEFDRRQAEITAKYDAGLERQSRHIDFVLEAVAPGFHNDFYVPMLRLRLEVEENVTEELLQWGTFEHHELSLPILATV